LLLVTFFGAHHLSKFKKTKPLKPLSTFPTKIGEWSGEVQRFDQRIYDVLGVDDFFLCDYHSSEGRIINLYIGYYESQREGELIHSPKNCMPGAGWNITRTSVTTIKIPNGNPGKIHVIKLILQRGKDRQVVLYWFQSRGRIISSEYWQKIYLVIDSILKRRTDGSFVRVIAPISDSEKETETYVKSFIQRIFPILEQYLPGP